MQQWIDLARSTGIQTSEEEPPSPDTPISSEIPVLECGTAEVPSTDDINKNQSGEQT